MAQMPNMPTAATRGTVPLTDVAVLLHPDDDVIIAKSPLLPRTVLTVDGADPIAVQRMIPPGHKVARRHVG